MLLIVSLITTGCGRAKNNASKIAESEHPLWRENVRCISPSLRLRREAEEGIAEKQNELGMRYFELAESEFHSPHVTASNKNPSSDQIRKHNELRIEIYGKAEQWFIKAAEQDHIPSQFELVKFYSSKIRSALLANSNLDKPISNRMQANWKKNQGQRKENLSEAIKWCRRAAEHGYPPAQFELGKILCGASFATQGLSNKIDPGAMKEAYQWFRKSADAGSSQGAYQMAALYRSDQHNWVNQAVEVPADDVQSMAWLLVAKALKKKERPSDSGSPFKEVIKSVQKNLTPDQFKSAEQKSQDLLNSIEANTEEQSHE